MIERYRNRKIALIWEDVEKILSWERVELAVMEARVNLGQLVRGVFDSAKALLAANLPSVEAWKEREKKTNHDLQAWVEMRQETLGVGLASHFHDGMTSYDTEETPFLVMLKRSAAEVVLACEGALELALQRLAIKYRYCPMMGITHGQYGEIQTGGKRFLTWYKEIQIARQKVEKELEALRFSKISGAMGNYGGVTPEVEKEALRILGFEPFYGATQILPRQLHAPLAEALTALVCVISKIGRDIRLGARSPRPIYQEPFKKTQTGSSRMPQKQNPIASERLEGMERAAIGYLVMIMQNIRTDEERAIEQSSVERIAWADMFHVTMNAVTVLTKIIDGLRVYPDAMMQDVLDTRGTWAAGAAKEFLRVKLDPMGITPKDAYRMVQLAAFNAFAPQEFEMHVRNNLPDSRQKADRYLQTAGVLPAQRRQSIQFIISDASLEVNPELEATQEQVDKWNEALQKLFATLDLAEWQQVFSIVDRLKHEDVLFKEVLGV